MASRHFMKNMVSLIPRNVSNRVGMLSLRRSAFVSAPAVANFSWHRPTVGLVNPTQASGTGLRPSFYSSASNDERNVDLMFSDLEALLKSGDLQLIDVREPKELHEYGEFPGAVNIPLGDLKDALSTADEIFAERYKCPKPHPHHQNIIFCAQGPIKSRAAMELAKKLSYNRTRHYKGGWDDYHKQMNLPLKRNPSSG